jgi:hypothetical protein
MFEPVRGTRKHDRRFGMDDVSVCNDFDLFPYQGLLLCRGVWFWVAALRRCRCNRDAARAVATGDRVWFV